MDKKREVLINLREKANMSQEDLALELGVAQQTVSQLETRTRNPSLNLAKKYELFFETPMEKLFPDLFCGFDITKRSTETNSNQKPA